MSENLKSNFNPDALQQLGRIDLIAKFILQGLQAGVNKSYKKGISTEFSDFKSYAEGDDIRFIDWRLYARTEKLFIKTFEAEKELQVMLALDASKSMDWKWQKDISKLQYAANLLASLALLHIRVNNKAGLLLSDAGEDYFLRPSSRKKQIDEIFAMLETVKPGSGNTLERISVLAEHNNRLKGQTLIFTDFEEDAESTFAALKNFTANQSEVYVFHILDKAEETLPFDTATHLVDSETGEKLKIDSKEMRKHQSKVVAAFRHSWKERCESLNCFYIPVSTSDSYISILMNFFEMRRY